MAALDADCNRFNLSSACIGHSGTAAAHDAQSPGQAAVQPRSAQSNVIRGNGAAGAAREGRSGIAGVDAVRVGLHGRVLRMGELWAQFGPRIGEQAAAICREFVAEVGERFAAGAVLVLC